VATTEIAMFSSPDIVPEARRFAGNSSSLAVRVKEAVIELVVGAMICNDMISP
jgi:hypothetical protein